MFLISDTVLSRVKWVGNRHRPPSLFKVINSGCLNAPAIMLHTARGSVAHFKHSVSSMKALHSCQKTLGKKDKFLIQDEPTRWDSTYQMLDRLLEQKDAVSGK